MWVQEVRKALEKAEGADVEQGPPGAASAGAGASNGGKHDSPADDDEAEDDAVTPNLLRLRLSYRTVPAAAVAAAPAVGVPECGGEPVETATTPLPRQAHCYAHGGGRRGDGREGTGGGDCWSRSSRAGI